MGSGPADLGSNPRETTFVEAFRELVPTIDAALMEIKEGSASQAEVILQTQRGV